MCDDDYWRNGDECYENYHPSLLSRLPDVNMNIRLGGIVNLSFDSTVVSDISVGFKVEPGIDIGLLRLGIDGELNFGIIEAKSRATGWYGSDDEDVGMVYINGKTGLTIYIQGENFGMFVEPYGVLPIIVDDESAKLTDKNFNYTSDVGFGFRVGVRLFGNHQFTIGYEDSGINFYGESNEKFLFTYSIMWQSENR
jgi:hypothetical protein